MNATRIRSLRASYREKLRARLIEKGVTADNGCIEWPGSIDRWGYGKVKVVDDDGRVRQTGPHRAAWLAFMGPIEGDLVVDHMCRNRVCMNVEHLQLLTNAENMEIADHSNKRGRSGRLGGGASGPGCGRHGLEDGRWFTSKAGYTSWVCRICARAASARYRQKRASKAAVDN